MRKTRVLIVDDSSVIRRLLSDVLSSDPDIEVAGTAPNAALALARITELSPDIVTLDVEMPDVSGLELLVDIRKIAPKLPVIMFSSLTQRAAATTLEALSRGATDYVTKPAGTGSREASVEQVRTQLIPKIKTLGAPRDHHAILKTPVAPRPVTARPAPAGSPVDIVAVGCSTGGPNALVDLFKTIPADFPLPIVIVQHMPPLFTQLLAERLTANCPLQFREAKDGDVLAPGLVYIAPGDFHMRVVKDRKGMHIAIDKEAPENSCRPAVDVLFRSVAEACGGRTLAVILTGMGQDGLRGCEQLHGLGAQIVVQDEATSVVWGMPGFVARAGIAQKILPLAEIPAEIIRRAGKGVPGSRESQHAG